MFGEGRDWERMISLTTTPISDFRDECCRHLANICRRRVVAKWCEVCACVVHDHNHYYSSFSSSYYYY